MYQLKAVLTISLHVFCCYLKQENLFKDANLKSVEAVETKKLDQGALSVGEEDSSVSSPDVDSSSKGIDASKDSTVYLYDYLSFRLYLSELLYVSSIPMLLLIGPDA